MTGTKIDLGPTGRTVADNVTRYRTGANLTYTQVSKRLREVGRPISPLGVRRIEDGDRRVDTDDLMALAYVLDVNAHALLLPSVSTEGEGLVLGGEAPVLLTALGERSEREMWDWADGVRPLRTSTEPSASFRHRTRPTAPVQLGGSPESWVAMKALRKVLSEMDALKDVDTEAADDGNH